MAASTMPLGLMLGAPCSPCCGNACGDTKPVTDPKDEGTWVPSGTWRPPSPGVSWTFVANPGDESGETWFFFGSILTSSTVAGVGAELAQRRDWNNPCNWYSSKQTAPNNVSFTDSIMAADFIHRANRLPPADAIVHVYSPVSTINSGPVAVKNIYFWRNAETIAPFDLTSTAPAHDSAGGAVFTTNTVNSGTINGGATFAGPAIAGITTPQNRGIVNGGAVFSGRAANAGGIIEGGATFHDTSQNGATVNGGATFNNSSQNTRTVNGNAVFNLNANNTGSLAIVNGNAVFNGGTFANASANINGATVAGNAVFNNTSRNIDNSVVSGDAIFNNLSVNRNGSVVNGDAVFNGDSRNDGGFLTQSLVNGDATFNDNACSTRVANIGGTLVYTANDSKLPICNGSAFTYSSQPNLCGCG
jgi:hypothetical protein